MQHAHRLSLARVSFVVALIVVTAALYGLWTTTRRPGAPFVRPGATDIEITTLRAREWQISYQAQGAPGAWYADVARHLEHDGWQSSGRPEYAPLSRSYTRATSFGIVEAREWVFVYLDLSQPQSAQIRLRRVVVFPWWQRLSPTAE